MAITVNVDGVGKVNFPDGYTPEKIKFAIENDILPRMKVAQRDIRAEAGQMAADDTPVLKKGLVALGRGLTDVGQGAKQLYLHAKDALTAPSMSDLVQGNRESDRYDAEVADELARFKPLEDQTAGASIGRAVGAALPTLVVPGGTLARGAGAAIKVAAPAVGAKVAQSALADAALTGIAQGAVTATDADETHLGNAVKGAAGAAGAVLGLNFVAKLAAPVVKRIANYVNPVELAAGKVTPEVEAKLTADGIDLKSMTEEARTKLAEMAHSASVATATNPAAMARQVRLESLPVPIKTATQGQLSKDFAQNRLEQSLVKSATSGAPLREAFEKTDDALIQNLDKMRADTGSRIVNEGDAGRSVSAAVQKRIDDSMGNVDRLYNEARAKGELSGQIDLDPLTAFMNRNPGTNPYAESTLKAMKLAQEDKFGNLMPTHSISLDELERVRQRATKVAGTSADGTIRHDAGQLVKQIDEMIPADAGGDAYRAARAARREHAMQFEEPGVIDTVTGMSSRTDRKVPFEDVFKKTVVNGSIDDLRALKAQLSARNTAAPYAIPGESRQALKDIQGQTIQYLKDEATKNAHGQVSEAGLRRAYDSIGAEKMDMLFGSTVNKQFQNFLEAVKDLKVPPKGSTNPSGTAGELMDWVDRLLGMAPGGKIIGAVAKGGRQLIENAKAAGQVESAINPAGARSAADDAAREALQNERLRALMDGPGARRAKRYAGLLGGATAASAGP